MKVSSAPIRETAGPGRFAVSAAVVAALTALTVAVVLADVETAVHVALAGAFAIGVTAVAYRFPAVTVVAILVAGQVVDRDLVELDAVAFPSVAGLFLRFADPFLLGIVFATLVRAASGDPRLKAFLGRYLGWTLLIGWMSAGLAWAIPAHGLVSAAGEFRTYYQYLLLVPYVAVSFRTRRSQWRLFRILAGFGLVFVPIAVLRGWLDYGFAVGPRWFNASSNFALLTTVIATLVAARYAVPWLRRSLVFPLLVTFATLTLLNGHRSVWLATAVAVVGLLAKGALPVRRGTWLVAAGVAAALAAGLAFEDGRQGMVQYLTSRSVAFTSPADDPTANWRLHLWRQTWDEVVRNPVVGVGLGGKFEFTAPSGREVTTSPHNFYLTLAFHAGFVAVVAYLAFLGQIVRRARRALGAARTGKERAIIWTALIVAAAGHVVFVVYQQEFTTMAYLGLAVAVSLNERRDGDADVQDEAGSSDRGVRPAGILTSKRRISGTLLSHAVGFQPTNEREAAR